jgi:hypothetical protein
MKGFNRGLAIVLAGVLILGGGTVFAVSPNAKMNPGRIKAMEMKGFMELEPEEDVVRDVEIRIIPMDNWNVGVIDGWVNLKTGNEFENFKGNSKIKLKLNNVTVNIDEDGYFSQPMPLWKAQILKVQVFVGKSLDYTMTLEDLEVVEKEFDLDDELRFARRVFSVLDRRLEEEELDIEDIGLVKRARTVYEFLDEEIGSDDDYDELMDQYYDILRDAEEEIQELLEGMIYWEDALDYEDGAYEGELWIHEDLMDEIDEILVIVDFDDSDVDDLKIEVEEDGEVYLETDEIEETDFEVRVELDGFEVDLD